ncbi:hypothetical protein ADL26_07955 [Thermoactinomyces vulgaris]|nr:hypothetical protein ADL26_07955 [Thermoactinomyces vulgaris]
MDYDDRLVEGRPERLEGEDAGQEHEQGPEVAAWEGRQCCGGGVDPVVDVRLFGAGVVRMRCRADGMNAMVKVVLYVE